jgi:outer membrane protein
MYPKSRSFVVRKQKLALIVGACSLAAAGFAQTAPAGQAPAASASTPAGHVPTRVGVIQVQQALLSTHDGQRAMDKFQKEFVEPRKKELDRKAQEIRDLQDKLQRGGAAMSDAAKAETQRTVDDKTKRYNRDMQDAQDEMQAENGKLIEEMSGKMQQVIDKYAQANGYAVIINVSDPNTPVLYASSTVDITKDIIDLYDKTFPSAAPTTSGTKPAPAAAPKPTAPATSTTPVKKQSQN